MSTKARRNSKGKRDQGLPRANDESKTKLNELPNTFKFAAETLKSMRERGGSAGSIVVNKYKSYNYKLVYALAMNTVKHIKIIKKIIHETKLQKKVPCGDDPFLLEILVGELLFGRGLKTVEQNALAAAVIRHKEAILDQQKKLKKEYSTSEILCSVKYIRVNHLKSNLEHVLSQIKSIGLTQVEYSKDKIKFKKFINKFKTLEDDQYMIDFHFPADLIILKPVGLEKLKKTDLIKKGKIMIQDKASFLAVEALEPVRGQKIVDACFAPGGKTSVIASKMKNSGKIFAFDVDKPRYISALHLMKVQGVTCCKPELKDFTKVNLRRLLKTNNIAHLDSILLDPSCSGSGIKTRLDYKSSVEEKGRLKKLQAFQVSMLKHALKAKVSDCIVYCTCSTSIEENEQALQMALKECGCDSDWEFVDILPYWPQRGAEEYEFGSKCLRSDEENLTNGFFIAKLQLVNKGPSATNEANNDDEENENENENVEMDTAEKVNVKKEIIKKENVKKVDIKKEFVKKEIVQMDAQNDSEDDDEDQDEDDEDEDEEMDDHDDDDDDDDLEDEDDDDEDDDSDDEDDDDNDDSDDEENDSEDA